MSEPRIVVERVEGTVVFRLANARRRNAMTEAMWASLPELCHYVARDPGALCVVVAGEGGHFCAGADIGEFDRVFASPAAADGYNRVVQLGLSALQRLERPVLAAIEGVCVGGGVSLAMQADVVFAAAGATFAATPARLGLVYGEADTRGLIRRVGANFAKDMLFSGRTLSAADALVARLIDRVVEVGGAFAAAAAYARSLSNLSQDSIRAQKRLIDLANTGAATAEDFLTASNAAVDGRDFKEGLAAFRARRPPAFPSADVAQNARPPESASS